MNNIPTPGYEIINVTCFNPKEPSIFKSDKSDRERVTYWECSNKNNCEAFKNKSCIMFENFLTLTHCPYGQKIKQTGYTKAARSCGTLSREAKTQYPDKISCLNDVHTICKIGDYIYLDLPFIYNTRHPFRPHNDEFWGNGKNEKLINIKYYTPEIIKELCEYRPRTLFNDSVISDYKNKTIPEFLFRLKRYDKEMFNQLLTIYPEADDIANSFSFKGKKAVLRTLKNGRVKINGSDICYWDGETLTFERDCPVLFGVKGKYYCKPNEDVTVTIIDNDTVDDNTIIIN